MTDFPKLALAPGTYAAEWQLDDRALSGELTAEPSHPPAFELYGDMSDVDWTGGRELPEMHELTRLAGTLRSNEDVVLTDARVFTWVPGRNTGSARFAVVGLGIGGVPEDRYARVRLQITGADLLFGIPPIKTVSWPSDSAEHLEGSFSVEGNPESSQHWDDRELTADCSYDMQFSFGNAYSHELLFAPVIALTSSVPLTVDEWVTSWITPLLRVASLATRQPERLSWLTVEASASEEAHLPGQYPLSGMVFGGGILQAPYQAEFRKEWRDPERRPLFTLATLPVGLPDVLRRWRELSVDDNPFIELYAQAVLQIDLPPRARFLHLIQALEALHWHEHRAEDEQAQAEFAATRESALAALTEAAVDPSTVVFVKRNWSKRAPDSLERRLGSLIVALPNEVQDDLERADMEPLSSQLASDGGPRLEGKLRVLRNQLSHGTANYEASVLRPWVRAVETLCRGHALRLLGFDGDAICYGLANFRIEA